MLRISSGIGNRSGKKLVFASLGDVFSSSFAIRKSKYVLTSLVLALTISGASMAATAPRTDLDKMELKFFHHTYPKEDQVKRLDRLEKMFFGEAKEGPANERLNKLRQLVPDLDQVEEPKKANVPDPDSLNKASSRPASQPQAPREPERRPDEGTAYPAISAIEKQKLGKDYAGEPVQARLARLEKKVFGKVSSSSDFTDRMDRLKSATGIDIARQAPPGTDWADDDVEIDYPTPFRRMPQQTVRRRPSYGEDGKTFSGRDLREDMRRAFGNRYPRSSGSGYYGMSGGSGSSGGGTSGAYGFGGSSSSGSRAGVGLIPTDRTTAYAPPSARQGGSYPPVAPPIQRSTSSGSGGRTMGLNQQVDLLEGQIFGRKFSGDSLPERVARLEKTVFPNRNISKNAGLPNRVARLTSVVPINSGNSISSVPQGYPGSRNTPPQVAPQINRNRSGLSKVLGAMGNFVSGGFSVGSYPTTGNLLTDPQTGLLLDRTTGNLIDPHTGMVVGRKGVSGYNNATPGYGYRSFNNGFAPSVVPQTYHRSGFGFGTGYGTGFGTGFGGVGGMWP